MQFTPQQLAGGGSYSSVTRIGNWREEIALSEAKLKEFRSNSSGGSLHLRKQQNKLTKCLQLVPHSYSNDGLLRFGDTVILKHIATDRTFACDPYEDIFPNLQKFLVTASQDQRPTARNTFRILRPPINLQGPEDDPDDEILKYGQAFLLACNDSLLVSSDGSSLAPNLYLSSALKNERTSTKVTNKQSVYMTARVDGGTIWLVTKPSKGKISAAERFVSIGTPVNIDEPFILNHRSTNSFLTVNPNQTDLTDFGLDLEVYSTRENGRGKISVIEAEFKGTAMPNNLAKPDLISNELIFVTASDPSQAIDNRSLPSPPSYEDLLDDLIHSLKANGLTSLVELRKTFQDMDRATGSNGFIRPNTGGGNNSNGNNNVNGGNNNSNNNNINDIPCGGILSGKLSLEDIKSAITLCGVITQDGYYDPFFQSLDHLRDGHIDYRELMGLLRGTIAPTEQQNISSNVLSRIDYLRSFWTNIDRERNDFLSLSEILSRYHPLEYPVVKTGKFKENEWKEVYFRDVIETTKRRIAGKVVIGITREQFVNYFLDLSSCIKDHKIFEDLMRESIK